MTNGAAPAENAARAAGVGQMKSAIAKPPALTTWSHSQPMRRACSMRSASEKPSSRLMLLRTSSALKCTALSRGANIRARVVLPAVGNPMTRILLIRSPSQPSSQPSWPALAHEARETGEQIMAVARAGRGLGVVLHREDRPVLEGDAAIGAVEQGHVRLDRVCRHRRPIDRKAMVHGDDIDL